MEGRSRSERQVGRLPLEACVEDIFGEESHATRVAWRTDGVDGVRHAATLGLRAIGPGLAAAQGLVPKPAITPVDRRRSNPELDRERLCRCWVGFVLAERAAIVVPVDGPAFEASDPSIVGLGMPTGPGRRTPLLWKTGRRSALQDHRHAHADAWLVRRSSVRPADGRGTGVADRGVADRTRFVFLQEALGVADLSRLRAHIDVDAERGELRTAAAGVGPKGRRRVRRNARVTAQRPAVPVFVGGQEAGMRDVWCLVSRRAAGTGTAITPADGRRFTGDERSRDLKPPRLGLGRKQTVITRHDRRDRRFLLAVLAQARLTRRGKAGEELGMERMLGATRPGGISRFRQGLRLWDLLPRIRADRLRALMTRFGDLLRQQRLCTGILGVL